MGSNHVGWDYSKHHGPNTWASQWREGKKQSPIDIRLNDAVYKADLEKHPLRIDDRCVFVQVRNFGVNISAEYSKTSANVLVVSGGPLKYNYRFREMHLHWGFHDQQGSEHKLNGKSYAAEMHIVHWNADLYKTEDEAIKSPNGLAVLAVFIDATGSENTEFETLLNRYEQVKFKDETHVSFMDFKPYSYLPANRSAYYTYEGSLTTPPCFETVTWIVFAHPVTVSQVQLARLRLLKTTTKSEAECDKKHQSQVANAACKCSKVPKMGDNFRPCMDLHGRKVLSSIL